MSKEIKYLLTNYEKWPKHNQFGRSSSNFFYKYLPVHKVKLEMLLTEHSFWQPRISSLNLKRRHFFLPKGEAHKHAGAVDNQNFHQKVKKVALNEEEENVLNFMALK